MKKYIHYILPLTLLVCILVGFFLLSQTRTQSNDATNHAQTIEEIGATSTPITTNLPVQKPLATYIEIIDSCGPYHEGDCVNARSGPGTNFEALTTLRKGIVLKVSGSEIVDGKIWYKVIFDEWLRYHDRLPKYFYVSGDFVRYFEDEGVRETPRENLATSTKRIVIDISEQKLTAYEGNDIFMSEPVSTGVSLTPTSRGTFFIFRKTPSRYMQGPIPDVSQKIYDLPGVPWDLYFTEGGAVIHGAYWHDKFGQRWSNGCVNLTPENAQRLYYWADVGIPVYVQE